MGLDSNYTFTSSAHTGKAELIIYLIFICTFRSKPLSDDSWVCSIKTPLTILVEARDLGDSRAQNIGSVWSESVSLVSRASIRYSEVGKVLLLPGIKH